MGPHLLRLSRLPVGQILFLVLLLTIAADQCSKYWASHVLQGARPRYYLGQTLVLDYALNPGGFLSLGSGMPDRLRPLLFIIANVFLLVGLAFFVVRKWQLSLAMRTSLTLILAGGLGNLIDRVVNQGLVVDFVVLRFGRLQTGVFNLADVAILAGTLWVLGFVFGGAKVANENPSSTGAVLKGDVS